MSIGCGVQWLGLAWFPYNFPISDGSNVSSRNASSTYRRNVHAELISDPIVPDYCMLFEPRALLSHGRFG